MNLTDYIASIGTGTFADRYGVSRRTAEAYRQGRRHPRPGLAESIVANSAVTWEGIYRPGGERTVRGLRPRLKKKRRR